MLTPNAAQYMPLYLSREPLCFLVPSAIDSTKAGWMRFMIAVISSVYFRSGLLETVPSPLWLLSASTSLYMLFMLWPPSRLSVVSRSQSTLIADPMFSALIFSSALLSQFLTSSPSRDHWFVTDVSSCWITFPSPISSRGVLFTSIWIAVCRSLPLFVRGLELCDVLVLGNSSSILSIVALSLIPVVAATSSSSFKRSGRIRLALSLYRVGSQLGRLCGRAWNMLCTPSACAAHNASMSLDSLSLSLLVVVIPLWEVPRELSLLNTLPSCVRIFFYIVLVSLVVNVDFDARIYIYVRSHWPLSLLSPTARFVVAVAATFRVVSANVVPCEWLWLIERWGSFNCCVFSYILACIIILHQSY